MTCDRCKRTVAALENWLLDGVATWLCEECAAPLIEADAAEDLDGEW